jgi:hypothetical protein
LAGEFLSSVFSGASVLITEEPSGFSIVSVATSFCVDVEL